MKQKYLFFIFFVNYLLIFFIYNLFSINYLFAENKFYYAKITNPNVYLYSTPIDDDEQKLFKIPQTFFVKITGNADDENLFYNACYVDVKGYVKKSEVNVVIGTPVSPYADSISFRIFVPSGTEIRSSPTSETPFNYIIDIPQKERLVYYGPIEGEEMISQRGNIWYYCRYITNNNYYYGYVYSSLCDLLSEIPTNYETLPLFEGEPFAVVETEETSNTTTNFSQLFKILLIVGITLPCVLVLYLLFKPTKLMIDNGKKGKQKIRKLKRPEYYELDD